MRDWPYTDYPTGWYQIGVSAALKNGEVKPLKHFGQELVLFRTAGGNVAVLDAYCQHLGAHIGHGGKVIGEAVQCPWHGWQWNAQGENVLIPYVEGRKTPQKIAKWHTREIDGLILIWYDWQKRDPFWEWPGIPEFRDPENFYPIYPHGYQEIGVRKVMSQSPFENMADAHHFPYVHGAATGSGRFGRFESDGHHIYGEFFVKFGMDKGPTWMTPNGPTEGLIRSEYWGLGLGLAHFSIEGRVTAQIVAVTPVDMENSQLFSTIASWRIPGDKGDVPTGASAKMIAMQHFQIGNDFAIWENQRYVETPLFVGNEEKYYKKVREFARQFYPPPKAKALKSAASN